MAVYVMARILGERLNRDQMLGCLVTGAFMFALSLVLFLYGSVPHRALASSDSSIRRGFHFSVACLTYAFFQIPVWCLLTGRFPPDHFTKLEAAVAAAGVVISMFGSGTRWLILFTRRVKGNRDAARNR